MHKSDEYMYECNVNVNSELILNPTDDLNKFVSACVYFWRTHTYTGFVSEDPCLH